MSSEVLNLKPDNEKILLELNPDEFKKITKLLEIQEEEQEKVEQKQEQEKNANFVQLYRDHMPEVRWLMTNHSFASSLLFFILEHMDNRNALACSYSVFEDYFGKSRMTIYRAVKVLEENGFIDVLKMGTSNVYIVNADLAWTDKNNNKKFAKYDGKILVSKKENKDYEYRNQFDRFKVLREREKLK
ncbi:replication protein [Limosilactobacillus reuteri]|uniref:replication/maintenance protein RepL n=1 Tax=Limosilactobacillus reuteri TaxID=1598 RepID=UPI00081BC8E4|nr:replication/maintenance protein RepL [Limosilactobacillus reuteri]OCW71072.1 replication protein [Limosilactobacillus reuteri]